MTDALTVLTQHVPLKNDTIIYKVSDDEPLNDGDAHQQRERRYEHHNHGESSSASGTILMTNGHSEHRHHGSDFDRMFESTGTVEGFLDFVASLRLRYMPHKGSKWDRVLQWAEFFASSVANYESCLQGSVIYSQDLSRSIWSSCRILLELGSSYITVLEQIFVVFYNAGTTLVQLTSNKKLFSANVAIRRALGETFTELINMVAQVTQYYSTRRMIMDASDFHLVFGSITETFFSCQHTISEAMWSYQLSHTSISGISIDAVRRFLSSNDRVVEALLSNRLGSRSKRAEYSCEWFEPHLRGFTQSTDKTFLVHGQAGIGKSVISEWVIERLRRGRGPKAYDVLSYSVYADIKSERTSMGVVKNLLLQLLDRSVGDIEFYSRMIQIMNQCDHDHNKTESALWKTLAATLVCRAQNTVIVVDGLDQIVGSADADVRTLERLNEVASEAAVGAAKVKVIVTTRPLSKAGKHHVRSFKIEEKHVVEDLERVVRNKLAKSALSSIAVSSADLQDICDGLLSSADGSFLWADIAIQVIQRESSFQKAKAALGKLPKNLNELVKLLLNDLDLRGQDTRMLLAWISAARRPFTTTELQTLLSIDLAKPAMAVRLGWIESQISETIGALVSIRNGVVRYRHHAIRQIIMKFDGQIQGLPERQSAETTLSVRCMAYAKICLTERTIPTNEVMQRDVMLDLFRKHACLEYVSRYWIAHFHNSSLYGKDGKHTLSADFKRCFSGSALFALLELSCWEAQSSISEAVHSFEVALSVRRLVSADASESIFQTLINLACGYQRLHKYELASGIFYEAYVMGCSMFGSSSQLVAFLVMGFIDCQGGLAIGIKSEHAHRREEMLLYLVEYCKHSHGASDAVTIRYTRMIVELYLQIKAFDRAVIIQRDLYRMCIEHFGRYHDHAVESYTVLIRVLTECKLWQEITLLEIENYEHRRRHLSLGDYSVIVAAMNIVRYYESIKEFAKAEQTLVELWQSISHAVQHGCTEVLLERKIQIAIHYTEFLIKYERTEEVKGILIGVWSDYREFVCSETTTMTCTEIVLQSVLTVGRMLKLCKVLTVAKTIFQSIHSYCKRTQTLTSTLAIECSISLTETIQEIVESRLTTETTEYSLEETEEIIELLEEVFESSLETVVKSQTETSTEVIRSSSTTRSTVTSSAFTSVLKIAQTLTTVHIEKKQWTKAASVCKKSLEVVWKGFFGTSKVEICDAAHRVECFLLAKRIAHCHFHAKQIARAEEIHLRLWQACKLHLHAHDDLLIRTVDELIEFYETTYQFDKAINILVQIYSLQKTCKHDHAVTIRTAYRLAHYCRELGNTALAEKYYAEIVVIYTSSTGVVAPGGLKATLALCRIHRELCAWEAARGFYAMLWKTYTTCTDGYDWTGLLVEEIFDEYYEVLDIKLRVAYAVCLGISKEYRERCVVIFGSTQETTIKATLQLASVYEQKEEHYEQAISLYEEVIKTTTTTKTKTKTTISTATLRRITQSKERLAKLYTKKTTTTTKGLTIYKEQFRKTVTEHGYSSSVSMVQLVQTIEAFMAVKTEETIKQSLEILTECISHIMTEESHSESLFEAAQTVARLFIKIERKELAMVMLKEMRLQIITEEFTTSTTIKFSMKGIDRRAFAFLVAFEQTLLGFESHGHFSEAMALLVSETLLYQSYTRAIKSGAKFTIVFGHGCRLALFYRLHERRDEYTRLEGDILEQFAAFLEVKEITDHFRVFFLVCLAELGEGEKIASVLTIISARILGCVNQSNYGEAYSLAIYLDKFMHRYKSFETQQGIMVAFQMACYLAGKRHGRKCKDAELAKRMFRLTTIVLREALQGMQRIQVDFSTMSIELLNEVCGVLGRQENYEALEVSLMGRADGCYLTPIR